MHCRLVRCECTVGVVVKSHPFGFRAWIVIEQVARFLQREEIRGTDIEAVDAVLFRSGHQRSEVADIGATVGR